MKHTYIFLIIFSFILLGCGTPEATNVLVETGDKEIVLNEVIEEQPDGPEESVTEEIIPVNDYSVFYKDGILNINDYKILLKNKSFDLTEKRTTKVFYHENMDCYKFNNEYLSIEFYSGTTDQVLALYYDNLYIENKLATNKNKELNASVSMDKYTYNGIDYICYYTYIDKKQLYGLMMKRVDLNDPTKDVGLFVFKVTKRDDSELNEVECCEALSKILADSSARIVGTLGITLDLKQASYLEMFDTMENTLSKENLDLLAF